MKNCDKHKETNDVGDRANKKEGYEERKGRLLWKEVTIEGEQYVKAITEEHAKEEDGSQKEGNHIADDTVREKAIVRNIEG